MAESVLKDKLGKLRIINEGESAKITATFYNVDDVPLSKAAIQTLTLTLTNENTDEILNGRDAQDIYDTNGGYIVDEVVDAVNVAKLTLKLSPDDNVIIGDAVESHRAHVEWTWIDGDSDELTGIDDWIIKVQRSR